MFLFQKIKPCSALQSPVAAVYDRRSSTFGAHRAPLQSSLLHKPSRLRALAGISLLFLFAISLHANSDLVGIAEREIILRQQNIDRAQEFITRAQRALADKKLASAYSDYLSAVQLLPAGEAAKPQRDSTLAAFSSTAIDYATSLIGRGEYGKAEDVAKTILRPEINPTYKPAIQLLARLEQPGYYNKTITPAFAEKRDEVGKLLNEAQGYFATGRYDLAMKRYEQALNLDPYNIAARAGMEQVNKQRTDYYAAADNETRSRMLWLVDREWERPVRKIRGPSRGTDTLSPASQVASSKEQIIKKLNSINLKNIDLSGVTIREAVDELKRLSRESDTSEIDPRLRGVNIVLKLPSPNAAESALPGESTEPAASDVSEDTQITMSLRNVPLIEAVRYLTEIAKLKYKIEPFAVSIVPVTENTDELFTKEYRVSPSFIPATSGAESGNTPSAGAQSSSGSNVRIKGGRDATAFLKDQGIPFPEGAFAQYVPAGSKLIVRNTRANIDTIDLLVEGDIGVPPTQVEIESKFVEITQDNVNELGFDWLLGPFDIGGDSVRGSGGTLPGGIPPSGDYYENFPFGGYAANPVTAGNRNGIGTSVTSAITANSLDALIAGVRPGTNFATPGILGLAGVFSNAQFQVVIRALSQQKGVDLMSAPKVTTKSGNKATVKIIREFPYPSEFDPPQVPQENNAEVGGSDGGIVMTGGMVSPATPSAFEKRDVGVTLEVEPQVGADNYTIDLSLSPEVVEFDGFVNYGSEIIGPRYDPLLIPVDPSGIGTFVITPNVMNQPIFSVRKVTTSVTIWDGQTVALGGLIREDVQKVNDKVPILGDIPLAGRLFRSNVDQTIKRNLIVFVTARLMDAEGKPLIQTDEQEETVEPLGLPADLPPPTVTTRSLK